MIALVEFNRRRRLQKLAEKFGSLEDFMSQDDLRTMREKMAAPTTADYLEERAKRGSPEKFLAVLTKVPDVPPEPGDEL